MFTRGFVTTLLGAVTFAAVSAQDRAPAVSSLGARLDIDLPPITVGSVTFAPTDTGRI